jgi:lipoprotein-anchoring transpeptidase ErfK/SrfK
VRPNGTSGWLRASDVKLSNTRYHITVELAAHRITAYEGESVILQEPAAIGKPSTPTPPGKYYIRVLLRSPSPDSVYGPYAYGLSAHSDVLTSFSGGDGEVGIHGNNDASVLGQSVSSGCVRMSNDGITRLTQILPLGTPVEIVG